MFGHFTTWCMKGLTFISPKIIRKLMVSGGIEVNWFAQILFSLNWKFGNDPLLSFESLKFDYCFANDRKNSFFNDNTIRNLLLFLFDLLLDSAKLDRTDCCFKVNFSCIKVLSNFVKRVFCLISVFFHEHSLVTGQQEKGEAISLPPHYYSYPLRRHISRAITAESSPLHIASSPNPFIPSASR